MSTAQVRIQATGKRKTSVARIILEPGDGTITCNGRPIDDFFGRKVLVTLPSRRWSSLASRGSSR
jgi:ribosomal protein S9